MSFPQRAGVRLQPGTAKRALADTTFYWHEFDTALWPMLGVAVVLAAAAAAALTLTGAARQGINRSVQCSRCSQPMDRLLKHASEGRAP